MPYAAIDSSAPLTGAVYGIGRSPAAALRDARRNGETDAEYATVPISRAAFAYVREHGGAPSPNLSVARVGVLLREEAEEDEPRDQVLPIRLTASEYRVLREGARRAGLGVGSWLRSLGLAEARRPA